jgi:hypothetical protein
MSSEPIPREARPFDREVGELEGATGLEPAASYVVPRQNVICAENTASG